MIIAGAGLAGLIAGNIFIIVDMEAYELAKVCAMMGKDFICYKFVSESAD